jgi:hypothetical protein
VADKTLAWSAAESAARMAWMDQGSGNAYLLIYGTVKPSTAGDAPGGAALMRIDLAKPSGVVQADGSLNLLLADDVAVGISVGTAVWARLYNGDDAAGLDMVVSNFSGSGEVRMSRLSVIVGGEARIVLATLK